MGVGEFVIDKLGFEPEEDVCEFNSIPEDGYYDEPEEEDICEGNCRKCKWRSECSNVEVR